MSTIFWQWLKAFNLLTLTNGERNIGNAVGNVGNSTRKKCKSKHQFDGAKVCKADQVKEYFLNPKVLNEVFN